MTRLLLVVTATAWLPACAQTQEPPAAGVAYEPVFSAEDIADLVAPIALYPDDLLAIVLPASTYPLQIVEAQRFLDAVANDPSRKPPEDWDDSVVALLNYPEVVTLMNDDLDWTENLGEAVLAQQPEVLAAIEGFRKRAYTSGNLRSDDRQVVEVEDDAIRIRPANPQVIYVPYYAPAAVTVYRTVPAYYYYPRPYPVYYYPYPADYVFTSGFFWGVTTFYTLGWHTQHIHVYYYDYDYHPFYGRPYYYQRHYYRRPPPHYRAAPGYRVNDGSWERHEYPRDRDRQYYDRDYDRDGDRSLDGYTAESRDPDRATLPVRDSTETYWRPDYRRTGARPGTDPRRAMYRRGEPQQQRVGQRPPPPATAGAVESPTVAQPIPPEPGRRPGESREQAAREQDRYRGQQSPNGAAGSPPDGTRAGNPRGQPREGSLQQRMEAQSRVRPEPAAPPDRRQFTSDPAQDRALQRLERQEQEQARRQIESQERDRREFEQQLQRDQARQRYEQGRSEQNQRALEQRERAPSQRDYAQQQRERERQRSEQAQREQTQREQTQRQFDQQQRDQTQRQYEQQRSRQEQGERDQRQYEQQREQDQRRYEQESRQQEQRRFEQESRERTQQPFQPPQFAPQSRQPRPSVPQPRSSQEVRAQPRTPEAPRNYRSASGVQRVERTARQPEQRRVETRTTERAEQRGDRAEGRSNGSARNEGNGAESGGRSLGREVNGGWARN